MPRRRADLPAETFTKAFAERMESEQQDRGWSDAALAQRASVYYPISHVSIWKIKHGEPRRNINLDEGLAISRAFGVTGAEEFVGTKALNAFSHIVEDLSDDVAEAVKRIDRVRKLVPHLVRAGAAAGASGKPGTRPRTWVNTRMGELLREMSSLQKEAARLVDDLKKASGDVKKGGTS